MEWIVDATESIPPLELEDEKHLEKQLEHLVSSHGQVKIEIFSNEHPPPHFRVKLRNGECWNFDIANCEPLKNEGSPPRKIYRQVAKWWVGNKKLLINMWNESRPTNCPVGVFNG